MPENEVPKALAGRSAKTLILNARDVTTLTGDVSDIAKKQEAIFEILNNPRPTAAMRMVEYIFADRVKMGIALLFCLGCGAIATGTYMTWDDKGGVTIGSQKQTSVKEHPPR